MDHPIVTSNLCERCSLIRFDDAAAGCREVVDEEGIARLSFKDAEVEWRVGKSGTRHYEFGLIKLGWHFGDSLPGMPQLSASSQAGCDFCNSLRLGLETGLADLPSKYDMRDGPIVLTAYLWLGEQGIGGVVVEVVSNQDEEAENLEPLLVYFGVEASPGCRKWLGADPCRHSDYMAPENARQMRRILAECTANCHPWKASSNLPTRLIDVGTRFEDVPRLVISAEDLVSTEIKYAALSYCWGDKEDATTQLKTEKATLEQRREVIPWETMTPAIKDAIELTRVIGVRYIWIDALCIIQDKPADWSYESGQMGHVYHGAFVTLCGLNSTSCHKSLLKRAPTVTIPFQSTLLPTIAGHLLVRLQPWSYSVSPPNAFAIDYFGSKWRQRAWTLQEETLPNRLLLFGGLKMHFQCGTRMWSEGKDKLYPKHELSIGLHDSITSIKQGKIPVSNLYETWHRIYKHYSRRSLTRNLDRLPAISGIAQLVGKTLGDDYLAGFWKGDIIMRLGWYMGKPSSNGLLSHIQSIREREYIAPSWSWAACADGIISTVSFVGWQVFPECTLLDVHVETDQKNTFGRVYSGYLRIRGKVAPVPTSWRKVGTNNEWSRGWYFDPSEDPLGMARIRVSLDWYQGENVKGRENIVMLLLHCRQPTEGASSISLRYTDTTQRGGLTALLLYPSNSPDEYYRVGVVRSRDQASCNLMRSWFEGEDKEKVCTLI